MGEGGGGAAQPTIVLGGGGFMSFFSRFGHSFNLISGTGSNKTTRLLSNLIVQFRNRQITQRTENEI